MKSYKEITVKSEQKAILKSKQKYEKPRLRVIEMVTEEVLGVGCKLESGGTAVGVPTSCVGNFCAEVGS
jgi:hypothetical protein